MKTDAANDWPRELIAGGSLAFFEGCTPAHRGERLKWIGEAKKPETRQKRIDETVKRLREKKNREDILAAKNV